MKKHKQIVDSAFLRDSNYSYVNCKDSELLSVLCFAIARHHTDLILHQQRIELLAENKEKKLLFTAIIDLFTSLKDNGYDYKKRILDRYNYLLSIKQSKLLNNTLDKGLKASEPIQDLSESILNLGLEGKLLSPKALSRF